MNNELNDFFVQAFNSILNSEERMLSAGNLSIKEIHLIENIIRARAVGENVTSVLSEMSGVTMGTLTTSINRLIKLGYLTRLQDKDDKRIWYIEPTKLAISINDRHLKFHDEMIKSITKDLNDDELTAIKSALVKITDFFQ